jgi:energy-coupling factor transporter transmembrane protein EcfT
MQPGHITEITVHRLLGRVLRRTAGYTLLVLFTLIALYHFTVAGMMSLEDIYGVLHARLIVAAIYLAAAIIVLIVLWVTRAKLLTSTTSGDTPAAPRATQMAALIEAAMVGYAMARKTRERMPS